MVVMLVSVGVCGWKGKLVEVEQEIEKLFFDIADFQFQL